MSNAGKAVFLSYASQDAEAAKRICESLRAVGVEVWFDQNELVGGDAWDQKIRTQIKECALLVPIISKATQSRREAYFRLEWRLAHERTYLMAKGTPFLLPMTIDETNDRDALVPDSFLAVQWTKAPAGETPAKFCERVKTLLGGDNVGVALRRDEPAAESRHKAAPTLGSQWLMWPTLAGAAIITAAFIFYWLRRESPASAGIAPAAAPVSATVVPSPPISEARLQVAKARALFEMLDSTRDDFHLAEEWIAQAKVNDPLDAEVSAAEAQLDRRYFARGWDTSDARREAARAATQRAIRLAPRSFEVRFAAALQLDNTGREADDKERQLRELRRERPTDQRVLRALATSFERRPGRLEEAIALNEASAALPGGDPLALYNNSLSCWFAGRTAEADAAIQKSIAQQPFTGALLIDALYQTLLHGDLDGARATLNRIAPAQMAEDRAAYFGYYIEILSRRPGAALQRLAAVPRDWVDDAWYRGPKGYLTGNALKMDGRPDAAEVEWRVALRLVEERLVAKPKNVSLLRSRVALLAALGEQEETTRQFAVLLQLVDLDLAAEKPVPSWVSVICGMLGRKAEAIAQIRRGLKHERHAVDYTAATLRLDPVWDPLRSEPEFAGLIVQAEEIEHGASAGMLQKNEAREPRAEVSRPIDDKSRGT